MIVLVVLMMPVNWLLETYKWYLLLNSRTHVSFGQCMKAILAGLAFSVNTPNRLGEYVGRVFYLDQKDRLAAANFSIISGIAQLFITFIMGSYSLIYLRDDFLKYTEQNSTLLFMTSRLFIIAVILTGISLIAIYFFYTELLQFIARIIPIKKIRPYLLHTSRSSRRLLIIVLWISFTRFIIFTTQYILIWDALGVKFESGGGFAIISLIFLILAIVPTIAVAELGIRGKIALLIAGVFTQQWLAITAGTVIIWLLNLILPAIAGTIFLWNFKISNRS
jgi:hypothetical protein